MTNPYARPLPTRLAPSPGLSAAGFGHGLGYNAEVDLAKRNAKHMLDRPARLRGLALLGLLALVLAILGGMIWRNLDRMERVQATVGYAHRIQDAGLSLQQALVDSMSGVAPKPAQWQLSVEKIQALAAEDAHLSPQTPAKLRQLSAFLSNAHPDQSPDGKAERFAALRDMHEIIDSETEQREKLLEDVSRDELAELEMATVTLTALLLLGWLFLRRRILNPLHDLRHLLLNLAKEDFTPIEIDHLDPLLLPVFNSYNDMVIHLSELEESKRIHAQSLEAEVRTATQALLEQQRLLARAEKLAAVGELAAGLAHELRNPLAGIQMSCANLRREIDNPDQGERLDLIGAELKRMTRLLNELLEQGKQAPAALVPLDLAALVGELIALTRYQIPPHIHLDFAVPADLHCCLPDGGLRQALLNLILNAAQALDQTHGEVRLLARREGDSLRIEVIDTGPGFSPDMLSHGIRPFSTSRLRGTGLGLAMVQRFARELGGHIELANHEPHGASVSLILPFLEPAEKAQP